MSQTEAAPVSLGDKSVELSTLDRYKGGKGRKDRLALVSKNLVRGYQHFFNQRSFRCLTENPSNPAICCEKLGAPTQKFGSVVFQYSADPDGEPIDPEKLQGTLKLWLLTESKYQELSGINKQWPLMDAGFGKPQHDLIILCTEEQYQRMTLTPTPQAHWKKKQLWYDSISRRVELAKDRLLLSLGRRMPEPEIRAILGLPAMNTGPMGAATAPGDIDLSDIVASNDPPPTTTSDPGDIPF